MTFGMFECCDYQNIFKQTNSNHTLIAASVRNVSQGERSERPPGYPLLLLLLEVNLYHFVLKCRQLAEDCLALSCPEPKCFCLVLKTCFERFFFCQNVQDNCNA